MTTPPADPWLQDVEAIEQEAPGQPQTFEIGSASFRMHAADIRHVRWAGQEVIRRIFVTVRDSAWREVVPTTWTCAPEQRNGLLVVRLAARHEAPGIGLAWKGIWTAAPSSLAFSFSLVAKALCEMEVNRVGLVVTHPIEGLCGGTISTTGQSETETVPVSETIDPQPVVDGRPVGITKPFDGLVTDFANGASLRFSFTGELFELEDQRNYGDSSYKTYCPPLSHGFPRVLAAGAEIRQSVSSQLSDEALTSSRSSESDAERTWPALISGARMPPLGYQLTPSREQWAAEAGSYAHARIDVAANVSPEQLLEIFDQLLPSQRIELGVITDPASSIPAEMASAISDESRLDRILLIDGFASVINAEAGAKALRAFRHAGCDVPILSAINGPFAEVNRGVPVDVRGDGISVTLCPTIHGADSLTVAENATAAKYVVSTGRTLFPNRDVVVSPLTLESGMPLSADVYRRVALPWLIAVLQTLSRARASSVTIGADVVSAIQEDPDQARAWTTLVRTLEAARRVPELAVSAVIGQGVHVMGWKRTTGYLALVFANLSDRTVAISSAGRQVIDASQIWPPTSGSAVAGDANRVTVAGNGIVLAECGP